MPHENEILEKIKNNVDINVVRQDVLSLLQDRLIASKAQFGYWEKSCFLQALSALHANIRQDEFSSHVWLRLCIQSIHKATIPEDKRNEDYVPHDPEIEILTYEQFIDELAAVRERTLE